MLYLLVGKDTFRAKERLKEIKAALTGEQEGLGIFDFSEGNFDMAEYENLVKGQSLIHKRSLIINRGIFADKEIRDFALPLLPLMASSRDYYVFLEEDLPKPIIKEFKNFKSEIEKFDLLKEADLRSWLKTESEKRKLRLSPAQEENILGKFGGDTWAMAKALNQAALGYSEGLNFNEKVNVFHLVDAILGGNKNKSLVLFYKGIGQGIEPEEIFYKIWWGLKTMYLILALKNPEKAGIHPYTISKYKPIARLYTKDKIEKLLQGLLFIQERSRLGPFDLALELEYFLLAGAGGDKQI